MNKSGLGKILKKYRSGWVSVSKDYKTVQASGRTLRSVLEKIQKKGNPEGYLMKAAKNYSSYIGQ